MKGAPHSGRGYSGRRSLGHRRPCRPEVTHGHVPDYPSREPPRPVRTAAGLTVWRFVAMGNGRVYWLFAGPCGTILPPLHGPNGGATPGMTWSLGRRADALAALEELSALDWVESPSPDHIALLYRVQQASKREF